MMDKTCRVCLKSDDKSMKNLTEMRNDETLQELLAFISGIKVNKVLLTNFKLTYLDLT